MADDLKKSHLKELDDVAHLRLIFCKADLLDCSATLPVWPHLGCDTAWPPAAGLVDVVRLLEQHQRTSHTQIQRLAARARGEVGPETACAHGAGEAARSPCGSSSRGRVVGGIAKTGFC